MMQYCMPVARNSIAHFMKVAPCLHPSSTTLSLFYLVLRRRYIEVLSSQKQASDWLKFSRALNAALVGLLTQYGIYLLPTSRQCNTVLPSQNQNYLIELLRATSRATPKYSYKVMTRWAQAATLSRVMLRAAGCAPCCTARVSLPRLTIRTVCTSWRELVATSQASNRLTLAGLRWVRHVLFKNLG